jgi:hypothetical protein
MSQRLGQAFKRWWADGPFSHRGDGVAVIAEAAYRAGYLLAVRREREERESRAGCSEAEAAIALQVASGGVAGDVDQVAEAGRLLEAVERVAGMGKRVA